MNTPVSFEIAKLLKKKEFLDKNISEEVVYEFDTENPSPIRKGPVWI